MSRNQIIGVVVAALILVAVVIVLIRGCGGDNTAPSSTTASSTKADDSDLRKELAELRKELAELRKTTPAAKAVASAEATSSGGSSSSTDIVIRSGPAADIRETSELVKRVSEAGGKVSEVRVHVGPSTPSSTPVKIPASIASLSSEEIEAEIESLDEKILHAKRDREGCIIEAKNAKFEEARISAERSREDNDRFLAKCEKRKALLKAATQPTR